MANDYLSTLPSEIIHAVCIILHVTDVFALRVTCRKLLSMIDDEYLWHQILSMQEEYFPGLSNGIDDDLQLSCGQIQNVIRRALKLKTNWDSKTPHIFGIYSVLYGNYEGSFDDMRLLRGAKHLVTVRRSRNGERPAAVISAFSLERVTDAYLASSFEILGYVSYFDVSLIAGDRNAIVFAAAVKNGNEVALEIHYASLLETTASARMHHSPHNIVFRLALSNEIIHDISVIGDLVSISVISNNQNWDDLAVNKIIVSNWKTGYYRAIRPFAFATDVPVLRIEVKITSTHLVYVVVTMRQLILMTCSLNDIILSDTSLSPSTLQNADIIPASKVATQVHEIPLLTYTDMRLSYHANFGLDKNINNISLLTIPPNPNIGPRGILVHLRFFSNDTDSSEYDGNLRVETFTAPTDSNTALTELGRTGYRAVWIEKNLESDDERLMKLAYNPNRESMPEMSVLLPPEPGLPFKPSDCRAIAFDDATGRLCLGLYSGELYVLDYA